MSMSPPVVAILNSNDDTVEMLRLMLESEGILAVSAHLDAIRRGHLDLGGFLTQHRPRVIIYDLTPPYDASWLFHQHMKSSEAARDVKFVLTSTNPGRVKEVAGDAEPVLEIVGKPYDMKMIVDAVKAALA